MGKHKINILAGCTTLAMARLQEIQVMTNTDSKETNELGEIIAGFFGAVKYDDDTTEGSPFQGMWVYDGGKSAFPQETLDAWVQQINAKYISRKEVEEAIGEDETNYVTSPQWLLPTTNNPHEVEEVEFQRNKIMRDNEAFKAIQIRDQFRETLRAKLNLKPLKETQ